MSDSEEYEQALPCACGGKQEHIYRTVIVGQDGRKYSAWKPMCITCWDAMKNKEKTARAVNRARWGKK